MEAARAPGGGSLAGLPWAELLEPQLLAGGMQAPALPLSVTQPRQTEIDSRSTAAREEVEMSAMLTRERNAPSMPDALLDVLAWNWPDSW